MDRLRYRIPLLTRALALMLCTCPPWARAEFEAADSANLSAINIAVATYVSAIANNVNSIRAVSDENLPYLSTIKAELQTLRMSLGVTVPALLSELQAQGYDLKGILSDVDTISQHVGYIDDTLDRSEAHLEDIDRHTYESLEQLWYLNDEQELTTGAIYALKGSVGDVDESIDTLTDGLSGQGQYAEDLGELPEFNPGDIDETVSPYDDGQTILDRGVFQFRMAFNSWLYAISSTLFSSSIWGNDMNTFLSSFPGYLASAPTGISLTSSLTVFGRVVPAMVIDWAPLKASPVLSGLRAFVGALIIGLFGLQSFRRISSAL